MNFQNLSVLHMMSLVEFDHPIQILHDIVLLFYVASFGFLALDFLAVSGDILRHDRLTSFGFPSLNWGHIP